MITQAGTRQRVRVRSRTEDAQKVARKFLGDLQALERLYEIGDDDHLRNMAHDLEVGLVHNCISHVRLCFLDTGTDKPIAVYHYAVSPSGNLTAALHSGRFRFDARLHYSRFTIQVTPSNSQKWEELKRDGSLCLRWSPANVLDLSGLVVRDDGAYTAGDLALRRSAYLLVS